MYILMGMKHSGKSTLGKLLAKMEHLSFFDLDEEIEKLFSKNRAATFREIYRQVGKEGFQALETRAVNKLLTEDVTGSVLALGGGTIDNSEVMRILKNKGLMIYLDVEETLLYNRIQKGGIPPFLSTENPKESFHSLYLKRDRLYRTTADIIVSLGNEEPEQAVVRIVNKIKE